MLYAQDLGLSLFHYGQVLYSNGRQNEAVQAITESHQLLRQLADRNALDARFVPILEELESSFRQP